MNYLDFLLNNQPLTLILALCFTIFVYVLYQISQRGKVTIRTITSLGREVEYKRKWNPDHTSITIWKKKGEREEWTITPKLSETDRGSPVITKRTAFGIKEIVTIFQDSNKPITWDISQKESDTPKWTKAESQKMINYWALLRLAARMKLPNQVIFYIILVAVIASLALQIMMMRGYYI